MKLYYETSLSHHGIKGQKWGVRRYQNKDGTLTAAGRRRMYQDIKIDRHRLEKEEEDRLNKKYQMDRKIKEATINGDNSKKTWDKLYKIGDQIEKEAAVNARKKLINIYGEDNVAAFEKGEKRNQARAGLAVSSLLGPIAQYRVYNYYKSKGFI